MNDRKYSKDLFLPTVITHMKIGITTFWDSFDNYGQLLQSWALQSYLKNEGHSPFLIRYHRTSLKWKDSPKKYVVFQIKDLIKKTYSQWWRRGFKDFRQTKIINSLQDYNNIAELKSKPPVADAYITGSDQVWNYEMSSEDLECFFLQFGDKNIKRISYAPSIGHPTYDPKTLQIVADYLSEFSNVSVREKNAIDIFKSVNINAIQVLDPTLLLKEKDYDCLLCQHTRDPYVFIYSMNYVSLNDLPFSEIQEYAKNENFKIVVTNGTGLHKSVKLFDGVTYSYATPGEWLSNIKNSELVVTASFHGVVFCLIYHKRFIYTPLMGVWKGKIVEKRGNVRVRDLLENVGLNQCIYSSDVPFDQYIHQEIDWISVENKLNELREYSYDYLRKAL